VLGRFPGDRDVVDAAGEHGGVQSLALVVIDACGARVGGVGERDGGGHRGGDDVAVAFDAAGADVPALGEVLFGAGTAGAVLGQGCGERRRRE